MPYETPVGFDPQEYINRYADLQAAGLTAADAAWHYATYGKNEGRSFTSASPTPAHTSIYSQPTTTPVTASQPVIANDPYASLKTIYGNSSPTAWYEYASKPYYDINGELIQQSVNKKLGGALFQNQLLDSKGQSLGQYYSSPEEAAKMRQNMNQAALDSFKYGIVAGPTTPAAQTASMLSGSGLNQQNQGAILQNLYSNGYSSSTDPRFGAYVSNNTTQATNNGITTNPNPTTTNNGSNYQLYPEVDNSQYQKYNRGNRFFNNQTGMYSPFSNGQTQQGTL